MSNTGRTARLDFFADGVFAIVITLLVIEIHVPHVEEGHSLLSAFLAQWPSYLAYVVSFSTIGVIWLSHNVISSHIDRADSMFVRLNLLLLMLVAFIPYPTAMLAEYATETVHARTAVIIYGVLLAVVAYLVAYMWRYAVKAGLVNCSEGDCEMLSRQLTPSLLGYPLLVVVGIFLPIAAVLGQLLLAMMRLVPWGVLAVRKDIRKIEGKEVDQ